MLKSRERKSPKNPAARTGNKNALKHGAFAKAFILPGEDLADFRALQADIEADLQPEGPLQRELAQIVATWMWRRRRLNRLAALRAAVVNAGDADQQPSADLEQDPLTYITEKVGLIRAQHCAIKSFEMTIKWALAATKAAEDHLDLNRLASELRHLIGDGSYQFRLAEKGPSQDLAYRKEIFADVVGNYIGKRLTTYVASELRCAETFARELADQIYRSIRSIRGQSWNSRRASRRSWTRAFDGSSSSRRPSRR